MWSWAPGCLVPRSSWGLGSNIGAHRPRSLETGRQGLEEGDLQNSDYELSRAFLKSSLPIEVHIFSPFLPSCDVTSFAIKGPPTSFQNIPAIHSNPNLSDGKELLGSSFSCNQVQSAGIKNNNNVVFAKEGSPLTYCDSVIPREEIVLDMLDELPKEMKELKMLIIRYLIELLAERQKLSPFIQVLPQ